MTNVECFKAYDIRGIVPDQLNDDIAYKIGRAFAEFLGEMAMTIYKSDELALAVVDAVTAMSKGQEPDYNDDFSYNNGVKIMKSLLCDPELIDYSNVNKVAY